MITKLNHVSFTVSDVAKSIDFYKKALDFELVDLTERAPEFAEHATGIKGAYLKIAYLRLKGCTLELIQYLSHPGEKTDTSTYKVGSAHICFNVNDFEEFIRMYEKYGGRLMNTPIKVSAGPNKGMLMVYTKDPDGNTIEFFSNERKS